MFLTHLSKDQFIIDELVRNSRSLFSNYSPVKIEADVNFINDMVKKLPEQIYEPIDVESIKKEELKEEEELERSAKEFDETRDVYEYQIDEDISSLDALSRMIRAMKTIDILGQVTKKYWGELRGNQKYDLVEETFMLGLRTLGYYFSLIEGDTDMLIDYLNHIYRKRHPNMELSKSDIEKASRNYLFYLSCKATFGVMKRVSNSIGYTKLEETFDEVLEVHNFSAVKLINASIKLDHSSGFPWAMVKDLNKEIDGNYLAKITLKNLVINYLYMFITSEKDKQRICAMLDIKMKQQRLIDSTSRIKKESRD